MERRGVLFAALLLLALKASAAPTQSFDDSFSKTCPERNFKTSEDGQTWYLSLDKEAGNSDIMIITTPIES